MSFRQKMDESGESSFGRSSRQASTDNGPADGNRVVSPLERLAERSGTRNLALLSDERFVRRQGRDQSTLMDSSADTLPRLASMGGRSEVRAFSKAEGRDNVFEKHDKQEFYMHHTISADRSGTNDEVKTSILSVLGARERRPYVESLADTNNAVEDSTPSTLEVRARNDAGSTSTLDGEISSRSSGTELILEQRLALAFMDFLAMLKRDYTGSILHAEYLYDASHYIGQAFNVTLTDDWAMKLAMENQSLLEVYSKHDRG